MNTAIISGRLVRDPDIRYTQGSMPVARFTVAVDRKLSREKREQAEQNNQPTADFIPVVAFYKTAELCGTYLVKGARITVKGRIQTGSYVNQEGKTVYTTDLIADEVEFIDMAQKTEQNNSSAEPVDEQQDFIPFTEDDKIPF